MELIRISESKLKIMLAPEDLRRYELDPISADWDYGCTETRRAFRTILDEVREQTGFNARDGRIFLQIYPSRAGGCELFVTRLSSAGNERPGSTDPEPGRPQADDPPPRIGDASLLPAPSNPARTALHSGSHALPATQETMRPHPERRLAYTFRELENLLGACKRLAALPFSGGSAAYRDTDGWYLLLFDPAYPILPDPLGFLTEYGTRIPTDHLLAYLEEHARVICGHRAVEQLADY